MLINAIVYKWRLHKSTFANIVHHLLSTWRTATANTYFLLHKCLKTLSHWLFIQMSTLKTIVNNGGDTVKILPHFGPQPVPYVLKATRVLFALLVRNACTILRSGRAVRVFCHNCQFYYTYNYKKMIISKYFWSSLIEGARPLYSPLDPPLQILLNTYLFLFQKYLTTFIFY